jgi:ABC-type phosphate/phosphonate transport system substrate-binding protein
LTLLLAALALLLGACGEPERRGPTPLPGPAVTPAEPKPSGRPYRFAAGSANVLRTHREVGPLLRYLTASTGLGFELVYCHSYPELMQAIEQRSCDFGWLGAQAYHSAGFARTEA